MFLNDKADLSLLSLVFSTTCQVMKRGKMSACTHRESDRRENKWMNGRPMVKGIWKATRELTQPRPGDVTHW